MNDFQRSEQTNGLGIAGFVISLVGLCSGGLLSPIGLILSLVALGKRPKGFAIAGTIIGAIGSCGILITIIVIPVALVGVLAAAGAVGAAATLSSSFGPEFETQVESAFLATNIDDYHKKNGAYPMTLDEGLSQLRADSGLRLDHWGNAYLYEVSPDRSKFWLFSAGPDAIAGTADDIASKMTIERFGPSATPTSIPTAPGTSAPTSDADAEAPAPGESNPEAPTPPSTPAPTSTPPEQPQSTPPSQ